MAGPQKVARYAELHCRSCFSLLNGASSPQELIKTAHQATLAAIAITDCNGLYGIVEAREALLDLFELERKNEGQAPIKLLYGSELHFDDDVAVAIVSNRKGYQNLCSALSAGRLAAEKGEFQLTETTLRQKAEGLILIAGGAQSAALKLACEGEMEKAERRLSQLRESFGDRLYLELVRHQVPGDRERSELMLRLAKRLRIPVIATNDVYFHCRDRKPLHDIVRCVQSGITLANAGRTLLPNAEACLKSPSEMWELFSDIPEALERTLEVVERIDFNLCDVKYTYLAPDLPPGETAETFLDHLTREGLRQRLGSKADAYIPQLEKELKLISDLDYAGYFLTMWDVIEVCRQKNILCQGRGSAANSIACFALGITSVRPDTIDMLFERFISKERHEPPDIDLDIEHERREEIIQYVYNKYGRDHSGMVAEVIRYQQRSALRDVGKALGFSEAQLGRMSKFLSHYWEELDPKALQASGVDPESRTVKLLLEVSQALIGFPRHLSIHVGGFILSGETLSEIVPIENGRMADRTVIQWNKDDVDAMGMFKVDLLGLGMLTVLAKAFQLVREQRGVEYTLQTVPPDDAETYEMIRRADTIGVFQIESRAQMNMLPRLRPESFYDLVVEVAIVRPGPIQGQMVHPYLRRRRRMEEVSFPHPALQKILGRTLGVPLFQEQVMRLAETVGGYTPGQADQLRRDMAAWRSNGRMERHRERLTTGILKNGLSLEFAERIFEQIKGFGSYGFPESHAAAFAHLAYISAYLKCHYPCEFACALINSQPMGFYSPGIIVNDLRRHQVEVLPVDVQHSHWDCTIENGALRLGLRMVRGLGQEPGKSIEQARQKGPFSSVEELTHRAALPSKTLVPLAAAGALRNLYDRRTAIWKSSATARQNLPLFSGLAWPEPPASLPPMKPLESIAMDSYYAGAFTGEHPMKLARPSLKRQNILRAVDLDQIPPNTTATVAGLVITRQRPAAKGFVFLTLEDETGHTDVAVSPSSFKRFQNTIRLSEALIIRGRLITDGDARNIAADIIVPLKLSENIHVESHDFH